MFARTQNSTNVQNTSMFPLMCQTSVCVFFFFLCIVFGWLAKIAQSASLVSRGVVQRPFWTASSFLSLKAQLRFINKCLFAYAFFLVARSRCLLTGSHFFRTRPPDLCFFFTAPSRARSSAQNTYFPDFTPSPPCTELVVFGTKSIWGGMMHRLADRLPMLRPIRFMFSIPSPFPPPGDAQAPPKAGNKSSGGTKLFTCALFLRH